MEAHLKALVANAEALSARLETERRLWTVLRETTLRDLSVNERATNALFDAFLARDVTNRSYRELVGVDEVRASYDLTKLISAGLLQPKGAGRLARYLATQGLFECVVHNAGLNVRWLLPSGSAGKRRDAVLAGLAQAAGTKGDVRD